MPRRPRICPEGSCFHVLNRAVARLTLFEKQEDYEAFERVLEETVVREALPIFSFTIVPNHWHFVVRPETDWQRSAFFRWLTHTDRNKKGGNKGVRGRAIKNCRTSFFVVPACPCNACEK